MLNPAYQNPDRRGRAGVAHGDKTIKDEKACRFYGHSLLYKSSWGSPLRGGDPKFDFSVWVATTKQLIVSRINCRARSTLRALLRMAVPPVLSSTSAEYSLQEVKGCTMAQPVWHATASVLYGGNGMKVH
jgi:hypothetical protein